MYFTAISAIQKKCVKVEILLIPSIKLLLPQETHKAVQDLNFTKIGFFRLLTLPKYKHQPRAAYYKSAGALGP